MNLKRLLCTCRRSVKVLDIYAVTGFGRCIKCGQYYMVYLPNRMGFKITDEDYKQLNKEYKKLYRK